MCRPPCGRAAAKARRREPEQAAGGTLEYLAPGLSFLGAELRAQLEGEHARALVPRLFD